MMTRKTLTALALSICMGLSLAAYADEHDGDADPSKSKPTSRKLKKDESITDKTAALGQALFFGGSGENKSNFKEFYEKMRWSDNKALFESINDVKPWKEGDSSPTVEQEKPNAEAIASMFDEMTDKDVPGVVKGIWDAYKKVTEKPSGDSQYDEVVKRLWDAAQLKIPNALWPEKPPKQTPDEKDPRLAKFREAFIQARDERLEYAKDLKQKIKDAANGNKKAQEDLFGSRTDKDSAEANKFAVGANINSYIQKLFADGNTAGAKELVKALTVNNKMYLNNAAGKMVSMDLGNMNDAQLKNIFNDPKMASAKFVGHEPTGELKPVDWIWDPVTKSVIPRGDSKGVGGQPAPAPVNAKGAEGAGGGGQPVPADVAAVVSANCQTCHSTTVSGNQIIGQGGKPGSSRTNWTKMTSRLNSADLAKMQSFINTL